MNRTQYQIEVTIKSKGSDYWVVQVHRVAGPLERELITDAGVQTFAAAAARADEQVKRLERFRAAVRRTLTNQEAFTLALTKVLEQGHPSMCWDNCKYRGDGDDKCALGHLVTDSELEAMTEAGGYPDFEALIASDFAFALDFSASLASSLQSMHDRACHQHFVQGFQEEVARAARRIADEFKLELPADLEGEL